MHNVSPPPRRTRIWSWAPWLAVLAGGVALHAWSPAQSPEVHVVTVPTAPVVVTQAASPEQGTETFSVSEDTPRVHGEDCERRTRRRHRRHRRHRSIERDLSAADSAVDCHLGKHWVCTVERDFVQALIHEPGDLAKQARFVPSQKDGQTVGFKLYGIRKGSLFEALQFENGDLIVRVDDVPMTDLKDAVEHIGELKAALERGPLTLDVVVVRKGVELIHTVKLD